ncbi:hypothetical protein M8371_23985, partial [Klebsiella pneumoniae]|nr:hypothetical protein [Klebsiella pneumoniae]
RKSHRGQSLRQRQMCKRASPITARRVVTFRPGQKLKSRVENASPKDK